MSGGGEMLGSLYIYVEGKSIKANVFDTLSLWVESSEFNFR